MKNEENGQTANVTAQATPENAAGRTAPDEKPYYPDVKVKGLIAEKGVQEAIRPYVKVPDVVIPKKVKNPFKNEETKATTQKIEAMAGTTIENAVPIELTLLGTQLDPVEAVNKKYRIIDYTLALEANMSGGRFNGYAATGLKLIVTRLEEVKGDNK